jgi:hypothetical protein
VSVAVAALLVAGGAAGCSGGGDGGASTPASGGASSGTAGTASGASPSPTASPVEAPAGTTFVEAKGSGLRFAVPETWKVLDPSTLATDPESALAKSLEKTYGVSADQLSKVFGAMDLMVMGPPKTSFAPNVNVVPNPLTSLPKATDLAAELDKIGATTGTPRDATTPLGPAIVVPYELQSGANLVKGRSIVLKGPNGYVTITVSDVDAKTADAVTDDILATASPTP